MPKKYYLKALIPNFPISSVKSAKDRLNTVKSGKIFGARLNTVLINVVIEGRPRKRKSLCISGSKIVNQPVRADNYF